MLAHLGQVYTTSVFLSFPLIFYVFPQLKRKYFLPFPQSLLTEVWPGRFSFEINLQKPLSLLFPSRSSGARCGITAALRTPPGRGCSGLGGQGWLWLLGEVCG